RTRRTLCPYTTLFRSGKGGGAWKVAYADFVTAMMAFFLVMWICGQDQKVRKAVSEYFGDPYAYNQGISKTPYRSGSLFETLKTRSEEHTSELQSPDHL